MSIIDLDRVKQDADLLAIVERDTQLKKVASTNGGELAGACPFCGGHDRFHIQPNAKPFPIWMCRQCRSGKWDTVIGYIAKHDNLDPTKHNDLVKICQRAVGKVSTTSIPRPTLPPYPAYKPPANDWQGSARNAIDICCNNLYSRLGALALKYLLCIKE
jgi:DNA primase